MLKRNILFSVIVFTLTLSSLAFAKSKVVEEFKTTCDPVLAAKGTQSAAENTALGGTALVNACTEGKKGVTLRRAEVTKAIIFGSAATAATALAFVEWAGAGAACTALQIGSDASALGLDLFVLKDINKTYTDAAAAFAQFLTQKAVKSSVQNWLMENSSNKFVQGVKDGASGNKQAASCITTAAFSAVKAAKAGIGITSANTQIKSQTETAKGLRNTAGLNVDTRSYDFSTGGPTSGGNQGGSPQSVASTPSDPCSSSNGNAYLSCVNQIVPDAEMSAILANPGLMNTLGDALGRPLGDFVKGYDGDGSNESIAGYVASGMGAPGSQAKTLADSMKKAQGAFLPSTDAKYAGYKGSRNHPEGANSNLDFSKLMGDMMKQLGGEEGSKGPARDPAEVVFRQLDLLPASKIEENKDISLFARIGYRYRKKSEEK